MTHKLKQRQQNKNHGVQEFSTANFPDKDNFADSIKIPQLKEILAKLIDYANGANNGIDIVIKQKVINNAIVINLL